MTFHFRRMDEASAQAIARWRYPGEFAFYDMEQDPEDLTELLAPRNWENHYFAVTDDDGGLVGFFSFEQLDDEISIGLGLRPDQTGKGLGRSFLDAGLDFARQRYAPAAFTLSVATFNQRAIRLYRRAGFEEVEVFQQETNGGVYAFLRMRRVA